MLRYVRERTRASVVRHGAVLLGLTLLAQLPVPALADTPSAGVLLRRARYALAAGSTDEAALALRSRACRRAADAPRPRGRAAARRARVPPRRRGGCRRRAGRGQRTTSRTARPAAQILLARGWLAIARADADAALRHFALVPGRTTERHATDLALLGTAWARVVGAPGAPEVPAELRTLSTSATDPVLRMAGLLSLARVHAARGEHKKALRKLRVLRRLSRGTSFADDVELGIGLAQLDMGAPSAARKTFAGLAELDGSPRDGCRGGVRRALDASATCACRRGPSPLVSRGSTHGDTRPRRTWAAFFAAALDRPAGRDAAAALALADAAIAARKEA